MGCFVGAHVVRSIGDDRAAYAPLETGAFGTVENMHAAITGAFEDGAFAFVAPGPNFLPYVFRDYPAGA